LHFALIVKPLSSLIPYPFFTTEKPRVIGHRGAAGQAPENTLLSFQRAVQDGARFVELDVRGSRDGEVVIMHDATVRRTTNGRGQVSKLDLRELKTLDAGYRFRGDEGESYPYRGQKILIPTLAELFTALPDTRFIVEIKQARPSIVTRVIEEARRAGKEEAVLLATEEDRIMREIRRELSHAALPIATGFSYGEVAAFIAWLAGGRSEPYAPPGQAFQIPCQYSGMTLVNEQTVAAAHELGLELFVWTINDKAEMARLLSLGVDGIITDYPARLRALVADRA
jgi:glycerophosphoryl diester phosphodiesterase